METETVFSGLRGTRWPIWVLLGVVALWFIWWTGAVWMIPSWEQRGLFGDMFGGLNTLFSGLALFGVVLAVALQSKELQLQREELQATREELARTADAQEAARDALRQTAQVSALATILTALENLRPATSARTLELNRERQKRRGQLNQLLDELLPPEEQAEEVQ